MSDSRETLASIAHRLGCGTDTVVRVRRLYRSGGIKALHPIKPPGRPSRASPEFLQQMRETIRTNPLTLGYGFSTWSAGRLAEHLAKVTGIHFSSDQLIRLLHRHGFSFHRPKHTLKGRRDEAAYEKARNSLVRLKKNDATRCQRSIGFSGWDGNSSTSCTEPPLLQLVTLHLSIQLDVEITVVRLCVQS